MKKRQFIATLLGAAALVGTLPGAMAQTQPEPFKVGLLLPMTGQFASTGRQLEAAAKLYVQQHGEMVAGRKVELIIKDDTGVPDISRRQAQELLVKDKVDIIAGFGLTPLALAAAPLATQSKTPEIVMAAGTASITEASPYIVRTSVTLPQGAATMAKWAPANGIKKVVTLVSDYGPGIDAEQAFIGEFEAQGGDVVESLRVPLRNPDFAPFLQKVRDIQPDAVFVFVPSGAGAALVKQFVERGMDKAGIRLIGTGDLTDDDLLNGMGDDALGIITAYHYSAAHPSDANKQFVEAFKQANNGMRPNFMAIGAYDGMHVIYEAIKATDGKGDGSALLAAMKGLSFESPRGPVSIDPETRDIIQNIYLREVKRDPADGELYNIEFDVAEAVKDPYKEAKKAK